MDQTGVFGETRTEEEVIRQALQDQARQIGKENAGTYWNCSAPTAKMMEEAREGLCKSYGVNPLG